MEQTRSKAAGARKVVVAALLALGAGTYALGNAIDCTDQQVARCGDICQQNGCGDYSDPGFCSYDTDAHVICCTCTGYCNGCGF